MNQNKDVSFLERPAREHIYMEDFGNKMKYLRPLSVWKEIFAIFSKCAQHCIKMLLENRTFENKGHLF